MKQVGQAFEQRDVGDFACSVVIENLHVGTCSERSDIGDIRTRCIELTQVEKPTQVDILYTIVSIL